jgi:hypothetical protein
MFTVQFQVGLGAGCTALAWPCTRKGVKRLTHEPLDADLCTSMLDIDALTTDYIDSFGSIILDCEVLPWGGCYASDF